MKYKENTAIGIVTCDRPDLFEKCLKSINDVGRIYVMNSGTGSVDCDRDVEIINKNGNPNKIPVGWAKNTLIRKIREDENNKYIFVVEDDIEVLNDEVYEKYIDTAMKTGLWGCLSFGGSGPLNKNKEGFISPLESVDYGDGIVVDLYGNSAAAFCLYHRNIFREIGFFDERFINAAEHLDHYVEQYINGIAPPFWSFPDIHESWKYLRDLDPNLNNSRIRKSENFNEYVRRGWEVFKQKRQLYPTEIPKVGKEKIMEVLIRIEEKYGKKS